MANLQPRVVLVTGANRGIGFSIVQGLATHEATSNSTFLLGCRDAAKGDAAVVELRALGIKSPLHVIPLDVTSDEALLTAVRLVQEKYGKLDVLVNNAGYAVIPSAPDFSDYRKAWSDTFNVNVTSIALAIQGFLPLLRKSPHGGKVINISSARGSLHLTASGKMPPSVAIAYSTSKAALNLLTLEMSRHEENDNVEFQLACPGHCKTAFNGYRGTREPLEGANVVLELVSTPKGVRLNGGCWETVGASRDVVAVPW